MSDSYFTIESSTDSLYKEKGSKFIGFSYPVQSEDDVNATLKAVKKEYYDARHVCYAFIIGQKGDHYRSSDDGEPSNSAGPPILGQIRSHGLTNTLVIVVRYFGGTKLGVGGLVSAYKQAATACLEKAKKVERFPEQLITIDFEYSQMSFVMRLVKEYELRIHEQTLELQCKMSLFCRDHLISELSQKLIENQIKII